MSLTPGSCSVLKLNKYRLWKAVAAAQEPLREYGPKESNYKGAFEERIPDSAGLQSHFRDELILGVEMSGYAPQVHQQAGLLTVPPLD